MMTPLQEARPRRGVHGWRGRDTVRVMETRPMSKMKRWRLIEVVERAK